MTLTETRTTPLVLAVLLLAGLAGCSSASKPRLPGPAELSPAPDSVPANVREAAEAPEPPAAAPAATADGKKTGAGGPDSKVIIIERGKSAPGTSLVEAARAARESRGKSGPSVASVTNDNLKDYQDAPLTFAEPAPHQETKAARPDGTEPPVEKGEEYWRSRVLDLRMALHGAVEQLADLDTKAAGLRRSFYAEDDPYVRDGQIKPAWDRSLDQIASTRESIHRLQAQLSETLEEGRRAGALPGWLREGIELEPTPEELPAEPVAGDSTYEPEEPKILDESAQPPAGAP